MKNLLTLASLAVIGSYATVEIARASGATLPASLTAGNAVLAFIALSLALIALADYGRVHRPLPITVRPLTAGAHPLRSTAAAHRHVYAIRRGAEAARLATAPGRVTISPRRPMNRYRHAA